MNTKQVHYAQRARPLRVARLYAKQFVRAIGRLFEPDRFADSLMGIPRERPSLESPPAIKEVVFRESGTRV